MSAPEIRAPVEGRGGEILTPEALAFVARLHDELDGERRRLLARRAERQAELDAGTLPDFLSDTREIRERDWQVAPAPPALQDRRVEITGPVERKMMINALNSGASGFMADFEDANSPTWRNVLEGQANLVDAVEGTLAFDAPDGRAYRLKEEVATLLVRPRGWHLPERHVEIGGQPVSASLFDFGLFVFHNAERQLERGAGPYLYLPKLESHHEARLWASAFRIAEDELGARPRRHQGDRADRDDPRRVRDGRDPLGAARPLAGAERGPLGLHLQRHQEVPRARRLPAPRSRPGHDGRPVHARVRAAAREDDAPAGRARDRRHGGVHPEPARRGAQRARARQGARGQGARGGRRLRRHLGRAPGPRAGRARGVRQGARRPAEPGRAAARRRDRRPGRAPGRG